MFLTGRVSGPELQEGCVTAEVSGCVDQSAESLAQAGNKGKHRGNIHRDIISKMSKESTCSQLYSQQVPLWDNLADKQVMSDMYFNLPHENIDQLVSNSDSV